MADLPKKQLRALGEYVRYLANELGLRDWHIDLLTDRPADEDAMASVACTPGRKRARLRLAAEWTTYTPDQVRHTLTHELVHAHTCVLDQQVEELQGHLGGPAYGAFIIGWNLAHELAVDGLADALAPLLPLPSAEAMGRPA